MGRVLSLRRYTGSNHVLRLKASPRRKARVKGDGKKPRDVVVEKAKRELADKGKDWRQHATTALDSGMGSNVIYQFQEPPLRV